MSEPINKWQDTLNQLAAGEQVDWDTQDISNDEDAALAAQLKSIAEIQRVFASQKSDQPKAEDTPRKVLFEWGHLEVLEKLGAGGYGEVYRAFDPILNRDVALKLLKPDQLAAFHSKLFIEEAQRIARVRNRHVLAIHGAGVNQGRAGFWSDLIIGNTLVNQANLGLDDLLQVAAAMALALQAVHQAGLVHGDVKAANVMQDQNDQYVLMDFGAGLESGAEHTSNHSVGSPMLMAPELFQEQPKSPATDMYALGCLLFKLASDRYPVQGQNILDIVTAHQRHAYLNLQTLRSDLPKSLINLIQQLIASNPAHRPAAAQVNVMIDDIINEPVRRKKRRLLLGIMGSLLVGMLLASTGLYFANKERQKAVLEQQKAQAVNEFLQEILGSSFNFGTGREVRVADILDLAASNALDDFNDQTEILADLSKTLGQSYLNLQLYEKGKIQLLKSLQLKKTSLGHSHPETLKIMLMLAKAEGASGRYQASKDLCQEVIELSEGDDKLKNYLFDAQVVLANVHTSLGDFQQAEIMLSQLIQQARDNSVPNVYLYSALKAQSENHFKLSNFEAAVDSAKLAISTILKVKNYKPTSLMAANNQLAVVLSSQGKFAEAEKIMVEQLRLAEHYLGTNNTGFLALLMNLGANLQSQGKLTEAVTYQERSVALAETLNGVSDRFTISINMNLANTYVSLRRIEEGEALMRKVMKFSTDVMGSDAMETLMLQYNLGELLNNTGRFTESMALSQAALPVMQAALGDDHLVTLLTQDNMAVSLNGLNQYQAARALHESVLAGLVKGFGQDNPNYLLVKGHQVDGLADAGDLSGAITALQEMLVVQTTLLGDDHVDVQASKAKLQQLLTGENDR